MTPVKEFGWESLLYSLKKRLLFKWLFFLCRKCGFLLLYPWPFCVDLRFIFCPFLQRAQGCDVVSVPAEHCVVLRINAWVLRELKKCEAPWLYVTCHSCGFQLGWWRGVEMRLRFMSVQINVFVACCGTADEIGPIYLPGHQIPWLAEVMH